MSDLKISYPYEPGCDEDGLPDYCEDCGHDHRLAIRDGLNREPMFYLPHSCDEWVIGNAAAMREMIADAQRLLAELEKTP